MKLRIALLLAVLCAPLAVQAQVGSSTDILTGTVTGPDGKPIANADVDGIETDAFEVIRGGAARAQMIALNRDDPAAVDERMLAMKPALEEAVKDHSAL